MTFETNEELGAHIAADLHVVPEEVPRTTNDIARIHFTELLRSTSLQSNIEIQTILRDQNADRYDISSSFHYQFVSNRGWARRT